MATQNGNSVLSGLTGLGAKINPEDKTGGAGNQDSGDTGNKSATGDVTGAESGIAQGQNLGGQDPDSGAVTAIKNEADLIGRDLNQRPEDNQAPQPSSALLDKTFQPIGEVGQAPAGGALQESLRSSTRLMPRTEEEALREEQGEAPVIQPVAAYKHRSVRHFKVGPFEFLNHILFIYTEQKHDEFLDLFEGLELRDQNAIVQYDWVAAERVEQPVNVARGSLSTREIKDSKIVK